MTLSGHSATWAERRDNVKDFPTNLASPMWEPHSTTESRLELVGIRTAPLHDETIPQAPQAKVN